MRGTSRAGRPPESGTASHSSDILVLHFLLPKVAYVDPSDPSVLYLSQPTAVAGSEDHAAESNHEETINYHTIFRC